jgi:glycine oxidase
VIATGADLSLCGLAPELSRLTPIKGHILRLPAAAYAGVVVRGPDGYAAPAEGGLTVGATMESGVGDTVVDPVQAARLLAAGQAMFPGLVGTDQVRAVVGVRAATPDGLPMIGAGLTQRVLLAVGARRNGWLLAPLAGRIIAAMVADADPGMLAARLAPGRAG